MSASTSSSAAVVTSFWELLGRAPEPAALEHYSALLDEGLRREELVERLAGSEEAETRRRDLDSATWLEDGWRLPYRVVPGHHPGGRLLVRLPGMAIGTVPPVPALPELADVTQLCVGMGPLVPRTADELCTWSARVAGLVGETCAAGAFEPTQVTYLGHSYSATYALLVGLQSQGRIICGGPAVRLGTWISRLLPAGDWRPEMKPLFDFLYWGSGADEPEVSAELDALIGGLVVRASGDVEVQVYTSETDAFYEDTLELLRSAVRTSSRLELHVGEYEDHDDLEQPFVAWAVERFRR